MTSSTGLGKSLIPKLRDLASSMTFATGHRGKLLQPWNRSFAGAQGGDSIDILGDRPDNRPERRPKYRPESPQALVVH